MLVSSTSRFSLKDILGNYGGKSSLKLILEVFFPKNYPFFSRHLKVRTRFRHFFWGESYKL